MENQYIPLDFFFGLFWSNEMQLPLILRFLI